jgi:hypothetical protein
LLETENPKNRLAEKRCETKEFWGSESGKKLKRNFSSHNIQRMKENREYAR